ncbi:hypothetical protein ZWY2020_008973 [Hordeum vulgare]|nr:hypothetical protein ZWY2020_008973 [Hordeum vulgare]
MCPPGELLLRVPLTPLSICRVAPRETAPHARAPPPSHAHAHARFPSPHWSRPSTSAHARAHLRFAAATLLLLCFAPALLLALLLRRCWPYNARFHYALALLATPMLAPALVHTPEAVLAATRRVAHAAYRRALPTPAHTRPPSSSLARPPATGSRDRCPLRHTLLFPAHAQPPCPTCCSPTQLRPASLRPGLRPKVVCTPGRMCGRAGPLRCGAAQGRSSLFRGPGQT